MLATDELREMLRSEIAACVTESLSEMRRFIARRFDELSAEIHASATMAEMTEESLANQITTVQRELARMVKSPALENRTSGLELEAVVRSTEQAANEILEAAEAITELTSSGRQVEMAAEIGAQVQRIFEACSFQDITGQRVRRAIQHLEQVDVMLNNITGTEQKPATPVPDGNFGGTGADLDQSLVDQLFD